MTKKVFIRTFGCQMNEYDSNRIQDIVLGEGYKITENMGEAELVLINTCSVRENPENKVYSLIGRLAILKKKNPQLIVGVGGCVAQQEGEKILKRSQVVDLVFGTDCIPQLPEMLQKVKSGKRVLSTGWMPRERKIQNFISEKEIQSGHVDGCKGMVAITKGCDNFCSFCIVPTTRGRLVSRELENILAEVKDLIEKGAKEIHLLGQNVNSYQAGESGFYELLKSVVQLDGLQRLRFISPHPNDWTDRLSDLMAGEPVICNQLHLPFQAGSDRILELMRRGHSVREYLSKIDYLKKKIPEIDLSTDIIVGFPGETDSEFQETLKILKKINFSQVYAFKYSPRPGTKALGMEDTVPTKIKESRLAELLELQNSLMQKKLQSFLRQKLEVLIENAHPQERLAMSGRSEGNIPITLPDCDLSIGTLVTAKITNVRTHSLVGEVVA